VNNYIAGLCADMTFLGVNNPGKVFYKANPDSFCIEFKSVPYWDPNWPGFNQTSDNTFEIILNRADTSITVNFLNVSGTSVSNFTSGIENNIGNYGLQPLSTQPPGSFYTIKYYYPPNALPITDVGVDWNDADGDGGIFLANMSGPHQLSTQVANHGNQNTPSFSVYGKVKELNNTILVSDSATTLAFVPSQYQVINFNTAYSPVTTGTKKFQTRIGGLASDTINVNDSITQEMVVLDTTQPAIRMCYTNNHTEPVSGSINWAGGAGGVGMYFKPPTYPARLLNTNYILTGSPGAGIAFYAKIYDDDGPGGSPGTLLDSVAVNALNVTTFSVTTVPVGGNVVIQSGGFYVNWDMANASTAIGASYTPPFSRQSYEVFQNIWSTYRDYQTTDFFIGADYVCASPEDVGVSSIVTPAASSSFSSTPVSCYIRNYGTAADNYYISVNYKLGGNATIVTQPYLGAPILPGDSVLFNFTTNLNAPYAGPDVLYVWTSKTSDVDHSNDTSAVAVTLVGIHEYTTLNGVHVYPVPSQENVNFTFDNGTDGTTEIIISDLSGKKVLSQQFSKLLPGSNVNMDLSALAEGAYVYTVRSGERTGTGKIILTR
jgi:hypothetical protein